MPNYKQSPHIQVIPLDDNESVLYDEKSGDMHYINTISRIIFSLFERPQTKEKVVHQLINMFEGEAEQIEKEASEMIDTLYAKRILVDDSENRNAN